MNKHTMEDLYQMQSLPLSAKIKMTEYRIHEWVDHYGEDGVYVSFSGGKDSTVLLDMVRKMYPGILAVYVDTGLEYPEIREFVKRQSNVEILRPAVNFRQVIEKYGYPFISKEVAGCVYGARKYIKKLVERENGLNDCKVISNHSYMADLIGIDCRENKRNDIYQSLIQGEIPSTDIKVPVRYLALHGKYIHKENGIETSEYSKMYNKEKYKFFLDAPFEISDRCCSVMKKTPMHRFAKRTGRMPMTAQMASESRLRTSNWLKNGCNGFHMKSPISNPLSFWTEQDILEYIVSYNLPIAGIYGEVRAENTERAEGQEKKNVLEMGMFDEGKPFYSTTGCKRTGCIYCGFGSHRERSLSRWEIAERLSNPAMIDYMLRGGRFDESGLWRPDHRGLGFWFVVEWINVHGKNLHIIMPHREEYLEQYGTEETERYLTI